MRFKFVALTTPVLFFLPVAASADGPSAPGPKKEKKICQKVMVTGSITPFKMVCLTAAEWAQVETVIAPINARGVDKVMGNVQPKGGTP